MVNLLKKEAKIHNGEKDKWWWRATQRRIILLLKHKKQTQNGLKTKHETWDHKMSRKKT